jgi:hypothetical protein
MTPINSPKHSNDILWQATCPGYSAALLFARTRDSARCMAAVHWKAPLVVECRIDLVTLSHAPVGGWNVG